MGEHIELQPGDEVIVAAADNADTAVDPYDLSEQLDALYDRLIRMKGIERSGYLKAALDYLGADPGAVPVPRVKTLLISINVVVNGSESVTSEEINGIKSVIHQELRAGSLAHGSRFTRWFIAPEPE